MNEVAAVIPSKWRAVGIQLGLSQGSLDGIQSNNANRPEACLNSFEQVFKTWKNEAKDPYTWSKIIDALKAPAVGEVELAEIMYARHCS